MRILRRAGEYSATKMDFLEEHPNENARIAFIVKVPFHFFVYKNIYRHLTETEFVLMPLNPYDFVKTQSQGIVDRLFSTTIQLLKRNNVYWRVYTAPYYHPDIDFFRKYKLLVSTWPIQVKVNSGMKKVRVLYGNAKDLWNFGAWSHDFDLILTYGPYSQKFLRPYTQCKIVGNPRFDDWFSNAIDTNSISNITLDPAKKTVLYLPTHGDLSSIDTYFDSITNLANDYNLVVRLHYLTVWDEPERVHRFESRKNVVVFHDDVDLLPLLKISDIVISDNSGAVFDAMLADKSLVILDTTTKEFFKKHLYSQNESWRPIKRLTFEMSIEQKIKQPGWEIGWVVRDPNCIAETVEKSIRYPEKYASGRKRIREMLFSFTDGNSGERAAKEIVKLFQRPKPKKTFYSLAIDTHLKMETQHLQNQIVHLENLLNPKKESSFIKRIASKVIKRIKQIV